MKEITLPWQGGEVVLSHSVPAFPPVETAPTIRVKLTEYHRRPETKVLVILCKVITVSSETNIRRQR